MSRSTLDFDGLTAASPDPGVERVTPDAQGGYATGVLWLWDNWSGTDETATRS